MSDREVLEGLIASAHARIRVARREAKAAEDAFYEADAKLLAAKQRLQAECDYVTSLANALAPLPAIQPDGGTR